MKYLTPVSFAVAVLAGCNASSRPVTTKTESGTTKSPSGEVAADQDQSLVRLVNAGSGSNVSLMADDQALFDGVAPKQVTPYKPIKENMVTFAVREPSQSGTEPAKNREVLVDGQRYTAIVLPTDKDGAHPLRVLHDELTPDAGKARIRVINAAQGAGELDVALRGANDAPGLDADKAARKVGKTTDSVAGRVGDKTQNAVRDASNGDLFDNLNYGSEGGFKDIDPTTATLEVRKDGENRALVSLTNVRFEPGTAYTFVVTGGMGTPLEVIRFEDKVGPKNGDVGVNR